jgi:biopolymer transport protein TolR
MGFSASSSGGSAEINVTPLIDVLLVLLTIFMVIGPVLPHGVESSVPKPGDSATNAAQPVMVRILTGEPGSSARYRIGSQDALFEEIRPRLQEMFAARPEEERTLYVQADRELNYQQVAQIAGVGRAAGASAVALVSGK